MVQLDFTHEHARDKCLPPVKANGDQTGAVRPLTCVEGILPEQSCQLCSKQSEADNVQPTSSYSMRSCCKSEFELSIDDLRDRRRTMTKFVHALALEQDLC
jgi:hypothetical protein